MFGSQPFSFLPISTESHVEVVVVIPVKNLIVQLPQPTIHVVFLPPGKHSKVCYVMCGPGRWPHGKGSTIYYVSTTGEGCQEYPTR
jgi:hypothetical protein